MSGKKEDKTQIPEAMEQPNPMTLSDTDRHIRQAVDAATAEPVKIESVKDLEKRAWMAVPDIFKAEYPERSYKWLSVRGLQSDLTSANGMFQLVNRSNHSKIPDAFFDLATGGVLYSGQNILAYTWLDNVVKLEKKTIDDFAAGEKEMRAQFSQTYHTPDGKPAVTMEEISSAGKLTPGVDPMVMTKDSDYDFGATT